MRRVGREDLKQECLYHIDNNKEIENRVWFIREEINLLSSSYQENPKGVMYSVYRYEGLILNPACPRSNTVTRIYQLSEIKQVT